MKFPASFFFLLFIFTSSLSATGHESDFQLEEFDKREVVPFLNNIACAEEQSWSSVVESLKADFPYLMGRSSPAKALSLLNKPILDSDDNDLIKLYQRAVRNHDTLSQEKADPFTFYYKHYEAPHFLIPKIQLTIDVEADSVTVSTELEVKRNSSKTSLILDGRGHQVLEVQINGQVVQKDRYRVTPHELILFDVPKEDLFSVKIRSLINPFLNRTLEGMYQCGKWLTTQCESEGARRIFFTLDRPDVLSQITTTIIADKEKYPYRLSNGNLISEEQMADGRWSIIWSDPFPKPSYLFACVMGRFSMLTSHFMTKSGKNVELQIYVEPGKESRAHYALFALKKAMEFDEVLFDREYDLSCLKMVGIPDFNSGAMENKGLMIFNDIRLLVDPQSGTDRTHREVAAVVGHEYFHNWSGNRVTIRNWFEIALKEAFTDLRAMLFSEWLFGTGFIRPKSVLALREHQFPEELSEKGHPLIVESYVDAHSIYDSTTYTKGREVFRTLMNYIDLQVPGGFRKMQNLYFQRYDGQAVTFRELLACANEILKGVGRDLSQFERWFHQQGTPVVQASLKYDHENMIAEIELAQSCIHPRSGQLQDPFQIPFSLELLGADGDVIQPKFSCVIEEDFLRFQFDSPVKPTPIFMHGYSAPVILKYDYSLEDLSRIVKYCDDTFSQWEAAHQYSIIALKEMASRIESDPTLESRAESGKLVFADLLELYVQALISPRLSPLAKAQILEIPSIRALAQAFDCYDFEKLYRYRQLFIQQLAQVCKPLLKDLLEEIPAPVDYEPSPEQMQIRELRHQCLSLLSCINEKHQRAVYEQYQRGAFFDEVVSSFNLCLRNGNPYKDAVIEDFYQRWKHDKAVFNFWLSSQALSKDCTIDDLRRLESTEGYDRTNPNHIRSVCRAFVSNLQCYHDPAGEGYRYIADKIAEVAAFNPLLAHNYIAVPAFVDFEKLPLKQRVKMVAELERLRSLDSIPPQTRDLVDKMLEWHETSNTYKSEEAIED